MTLFYVFAAIAATFATLRAAAGLLPDRARFRLRLAARRMYFVGMLAALAGCDDSYRRAIDGGHGGHASATDAGHDAPSDAPPPPPPCMSVDDCADLVPSGSCVVPVCDPDGGIGLPGAPVSGCYAAPAPEGTPCETDGGTGTCESFNGGVAKVCKLPP